MHIEKIIGNNTSSLYIDVREQLHKEAVDVIKETSYAGDGNNELYRSREEEYNILNHVDVVIDPSFVAPGAFSGDIQQNRLDDNPYAEYDVDGEDDDDGYGPDDTVPIAMRPADQQATLDEQERELIYEDVMKELQLAVKHKEDIELELDNGEFIDIEYKTIKELLSVSDKKKLMKAGKDEESFLKYMSDVL